MALDYNVETVDMLEDARTTQAIYVEDQAAFAALDPDFTVAFAAVFLTSIEASEEQETAETREDQQQQETADVLAKMAEARQVCSVTKYYVDKAFPNKPN